MYIEEDSKLIKEMKHGNNFGYILGKQECFKYTDYKVLQSQKNDIFIPCMKMLYNGMIEMYYISEDYAPLITILPELKSDSLFTIVMNLFSSVLEVKNNGFLTSQNIVISWDKVYVDTSTLKIKLVYLPMNQDFTESYGAFVNGLRSSIIKLINSSVLDPNEKLRKLAIDMSNGSLSIDDICGKTKGINMQTADIHAGSSQIHKNISNGNSNMAGDMRIISMNSQERIEIIVNKEEIVIGKKMGSVDVVIAYNKMISRQHCKIARKNNEVYIIDLGSANGTYVNQVRMQEQRPFKIKKGDILRLANSDFQVI